MTDVPAPRDSIRFERAYEATLEEVWSLWTTPEGFAAWWGPRGFRVEVHALEPRPGGALLYDMIAAGAQEIAFMDREGMPRSHPVRATFVDVEAPRRLTIRNVIDFVPGVAPYLNDIRVELVAEGATVRMIVDVDAHADAAWTGRAAAGWESQLTKLPDALVARRR
ncbi:MAG: SRPBCC domain-containing protein [Polyangiales bacterium]